MSGLAAKLEATRTGQRQGLYVTPHHTKWLAMPEDERLDHVTEEAAEFAKQVLLGKHKKARPGRISPSSIAGCPRKSLFSYAGAPQVGHALDTISLFDKGAKDHIFWQVEGLSMGWLTGAEIYVAEEARRLGGSMDGELANGAGPVEFKTCRYSVYKRVVQEGIDEPHGAQFVCYLIMRDADVGSMVYEEKTTGAFKEVRVGVSEARLRWLNTRLEQLNDHIESDTLPAMLPECQRRVGVFHECPFRLHCPTANKVSLVKD